MRCGCTGGGDTAASAFAYFSDGVAELEGGHWHEYVPDTTQGPEQRFYLVRHGFYLKQLEQAWGDAAAADRLVFRSFRLCFDGPGVSFRKNYVNGNFSFKLETKAEWVPDSDSEDPLDGETVYFLRFVSAFPALPPVPGQGV